MINARIVLASIIIFANIFNASVNAETHSKIHKSKIFTKKYSPKTVFVKGTTTKKGGHIKMHYRSRQRK